MTRKTTLLDPIPPGEILKEEFMVPHRLSGNALARAIHVPPGRISQIITGRRAISADSALRLARFFGTSPELWLNLQSEYDLRMARRGAWSNEERRIRPLAV